MLVVVENPVMKCAGDTAILEMPEPRIDTTGHGPWTATGVVAAAGAAVEGAGADPVMESVFLDILRVEDQDQNLLVVIGAGADRGRPGAALAQPPEAIPPEGDLQSAALVASLRIMQEKRTWKWNVLALVPVPDPKLQLDPDPLTAIGK